MGAIGNDQHVFIAGTTGSGKTFLAQFYLSRNEKPVYVLDSKGTFEWPSVPEKDRIIITDLADIQEAARNYKRVIYRPKREQLEPEFYNAFFEWAYFLRNCTVYVDEAAQICPSANPAGMPEFYKGILTRGRELNVNIWSATQRPANIPVIVYAEASHWFIFRLTTLPDRRRLVDHTGFREFLEPMEKRIFWYYDADASNPPKRGTLKIGERG